MATFVLIHGAYQGGWIWNPVVARLRADGHVVYAPTLDGCAERRHLAAAAIPPRRTSGGRPTCSRRPGRRWTPATIRC